MALIDDFLKAYTYFVESGLPEKLAKELAESVTGAKADDKTLKAFEPEVKKQYGSKTPKKLATRKERGELNFISSKISNPLQSKLVLQGLDGTTDSLYSTFRREKEAIKNGMIDQMNRAQVNNMAISRKDLDNIIYNLKIYKQLDDKVNQLSNDLIDAGKEPEKIYKNFISDFSKRKRSGNEALEKRLDEEYIKDQGIFASLNESLKKMEKAVKEIEDIKSGKADIDRKNKAKLKYQGKGYGPNEGMFRTLARQFLRDEIESGTISVRPAIYNAMKQGNHPFIDPIKVFRYHYGDDKFDVLEKYIDQNYPAFGSPGLRYPGRFDFRKRGIVPKNKNAPGNTYEHYSLPGELDQEIADVDNVIKTIEEGNNPFYKGPEDIKNQNIKRANLVKIKNEITPASKIDLTKYSNDDLNRLADEGNRLQKELAQLDETGSSKIPYQEFQKKSARLDEINEIIEEAKSMPEEYFDQQPTADVIPIKQEGIISNVDLNINRGVKNLEGVELYGDETFDELKYIKENGVHPRDLDPTEGFARGGIVEVLI